MDTSDLTRALALLGPLERRIMHAVWSGMAPDPFTVRDIHMLLPELAYTTVMTTVNRLTDKGVLSTDQKRAGRAYRYQAVGDATSYLLTTSDREVADMLDRYGEAALAAFALHLDTASPEQLRRLGEPRS